MRRNLGAVRTLQATTWAWPFESRSGQKGNLLSFGGNLYFQLFQRLQHKKVQLLANVIEAVAIYRDRKKFHKDNKGLYFNVVKKNVGRLHLFYIGQVAPDLGDQRFYFIRGCLQVNVQGKFASDL